MLEIKNENSNLAAENNYSMLTYNPDDERSPSESENEDSSSEKQEFGSNFKGPRIVKPGQRNISADLKTDVSEPETPKGIRGRRKALYSTPVMKKTTPQSSPFKQVPFTRSNTSPIVRATRATTLRQNNSCQKSNSTPKINTLAKNSGIATPKLNTQKTLIQAIKPLERQGTFTKDEPEVNNVLMVLPDSPARGKLMQTTSSKFC